MDKNTAYFEDCSYLILASWHQGNIVDVYGSDGLDVYSIVIDILISYLEGLLGRDDATDDEIYNIMDNIKYDEPGIKRVFQQFGDPTVLTITVLNCDSGMTVAGHWE